MGERERIQLRRTKGWRKPEGAVVVARPSKWGNPFTVAEARENGYLGSDEELRGLCVGMFRDWLAHGPDYLQIEPRRQRILADLHELRGRDLACWCPCDQPCHADVLLDLAGESINGE